MDISKKEAKQEAKLLKKIAKMKEPNQSIGQKTHQIIMEINPRLEPSSMYGMPAYKHPETNKVVCFFRSDKYFTLGITEDAQFPNHQLLHPSYWFIEEMNEEVEETIRSILKIALK
mgnify:CR=1 FL=1